MDTKGREMKGEGVKIYFKKGSTWYMDPYSYYIIIIVIKIVMIIIVI